MHDALFSRFFLFLLLTLTLAGCNGSTNLQPVPTLAVGLPSFTATYRLDSPALQLDVALDGPIGILDPQGKSRPAYRLAIGGTPASLLPLRETLYLDQSLRVVRHDSICAEDDGQSCQRYLSRDYSLAGALPPGGVGYLSILRQEGRLVDERFRHGVPIESNLDKRDGDYRLVVNSPSELFPISATHIYKTSLLVPEMQGNSRLVAYTEGPVMRLADQWPRDRPLATVWEGGLVPDRAYKPFGQGLTFEALLAQVEQRDDVRAIIADGGCFVDILVESPTVMPSLIPLVLGETVNQNAWIEVLDKGGMAHPYRVEMQQEPNQQPAFTVASENSYPQISTCGQLRKMPAPVMTVQAAMALADRIAPSLEYALIVDVTPLPNAEPSAFNRPPELGWYRYNFAFHPAWASQGTGSARTFDVTIDPWTGGLERVVSDPSDPL